MGPRYCDSCSGELEPYGDLDYNSCDKIGCPAAGEEICSRCADTSSPTCTYCNEGCTMCPLVNSYILEKGRDGYDPILAICKCKFDDCPIYFALDDEDRCRSCWEEFAEKLGCDIHMPHDKFEFEKCGHESCTAYQNQMKCKEGECAACKEEAQGEEEERKRKLEEEHEEKDIDVMKKCLATVQSSSARSVLQKWLTKHSPKSSRQS